jgi:hypothetical protein
MFHIRISLSAPSFIQCLKQIEQTTQWFTIKPWRVQKCTPKLPFLYAICSLVYSPYLLNMQVERTRFMQHIPKRPFHSTGANSVIGIRVFFQIGSFASFTTSLVVVFNYSLHVSGHRITSAVLGDTIKWKCAQQASWRWRWEIAPLNKWMLGDFNPLDQWLPTGVPRYPGVPRTLPRGTARRKNKK